VLLRRFFTAFAGNTCKVYHAPFDVRLPTPAHHRKSDKDIVTVVQPDLCVICDRTKLDDRGCIGAPDLVVEILSPGNSRTEMNLKYAVYEESGVGEYWIVDPEHHVVQQFYRNGNDRFTQVMAYGNNDTLTSRLFPELTVNLPELFEEEEVG
jgi:Uma2 family endonuclease